MDYPIVKSQEGVNGAPGFSMRSLHKVAQTGEEFTTWSQEIFKSYGAVEFRDYVPVGDDYVVAPALVTFALTLARKHDLRETFSLAYQEKLKDDVEYTSLVSKMAFLNGIIRERHEVEARLVADTVKEKDPKANWVVEFNKAMKDRARPLVTAEKVVELETKLTTLLDNIEGWFNNGFNKKEAKEILFQHLRI